MEGRKKKTYLPTNIQTHISYGGVFFILKERKGRGSKKNMNNALGEREVERRKKKEGSRVVDKRKK